MRSSKGRSDNAITALSFCHFGLLRNIADSTRSNIRPPSLCHLRPSSTHQASNLSTVIHTRTATPHYRSAHRYPHPSTKGTIAASTMHTRPARYARIIHQKSLLYVDITALIHNSLQSYPQSAQQFYTTVDNVFHNSRYLYPHLSAHRADTTAHIIHTLCTAFSTSLHRFSTAITRFIHRLYTRYPHLSTTYPQHRRLFHRLYRATHSHKAPLFAHLSTILSTRLSTLTSVINTPLRLAIAQLQTSFTHSYGSP